MSQSVYDHYEDFWSRPLVRRPSDIMHFRPGPAPPLRSQPTDLFLSDQQTVAASSALYQLKHSQQPGDGGGRNMSDAGGEHRLDFFLPPPPRDDVVPKHETSWEIGIQYAQQIIPSPEMHHWNNGFDLAMPPPQTSSPWSTSHTLDPSQNASLQLATPQSTSQSGDEPDADINTVDYDLPEADEKAGQMPYAQLIFRALLSAPDHRMVLKDIYRWIEQNTDKAADVMFKGWQNSVRHNLSMNKAFTKVPYLPEDQKSKRGYIWVLEDSAIQQGIQPTTRYRQNNQSKRLNGASDAKDAKRVHSGRKGGQMARKSAATRGASKLDGQWRAPRLDGEIEGHNSIAPRQEQHQYEVAHSPYYVPTPPQSSASSLSDRPPYHYGDFAPWADMKSEAGCTDSQSDLSRTLLPHQHPGTAANHHPLASEWTSFCP